MTVPEKLNTLRAKAATVGCALEIKEGFPCYVIAIVPDLPLSKDRFFNSPVLDGIAVYVGPKDMDKVAKHSRYYKALLKLEQRFDSCHTILKLRTAKLKACGNDRTRYADICNGLSDGETHHE